MSAVFRRELRNYFLTPIGYVFMGAFLLMGGVFFTLSNLLSGSSDLSSLFSLLNYLFMLIVPLLTMRLLSDERRTKTDQLLLTAPISIPSIVAGKFLAASVVMLLSLIGTIPYIVVIAMYATPYWGQIISNYLGFALMGGCYIAVGVLMSAVTESQLTAAILTFAVNLMLQMMESVGSSITIPFMSWLGTAISWLSLYKRYTSFATGLISLADTIYYLSFIGVFLMLAVRIIDKRRWSEG